jgi:hypothetical protein
VLVVVVVVGGGGRRLKQRPALHGRLIDRIAPTVLAESLHMVRHVVATGYNKGQHLQVVARCVGLYSGGSRVWFGDGDYRNIAEPPEGAHQTISLMLVRMLAMLMLINGTMLLYMHYCVGKGT